MNQKRNNDELLTTVFGSKEVLEPAPTDVIPQGMMRPEIAYQIVKDETYPQTELFFTKNRCIIKIKMIYLGK